LEKWLAKVKKTKLLKELRVIPRMANFVYIRQKGGYGNGTPVLNAKPLIGNEPFAVFWGDEFFTGQKPWIRQMIEVYEKYQDPVLSLVRVPKSQVNRYGIIEGPRVAKNIYQIDKITEKPSPAKAKSNLAVIGGYILTPEIFKILEKTSPGKDGELWLADAIDALTKKRSVYGRVIEGKLYDAGTVLGWLEANVELGLKHPKISGEFRKFLRKLK